jgi:hypothetical protein
LTHCNQPLLVCIRPKNSLFFGLVLLCLVHIGSASELMLLHTLQGALSGQTQRPALDSGVVLSCTYNPLLNRLQETDEQAERSCIEGLGWQGSIVYAGKRLVPQLHFSSHRLFAAFEQPSSSYGIKSQSSLDFVDAGVGVRFDEFNATLTIGRLLDGAYNSHLKADAQDSLATFLLEGPWRYQAAFGLDSKPVFGSLRLFCGPVYNSMTTLYNRSTHSNRTFPITLISHQAQLQGGVRGAWGSISGQLGVVGTQQRDLIESTNRMPVDINVAHYEAGVDAVVNTPLGDSLFAYVKVARLGGWSASYNFDRELFTFFKASPLWLSSAASEVGMQLTSTLEVGMFGEVLQGDIPEGFVKLSGFSNWSIFAPQDYKFSAAQASFYQGGGWAQLKRQFNALSVRGKIGASWFQTAASLSYRTKQVVVLLPVYLNPTDVQLWQERGFLIHPDITLTYACNPFIITAFVNQWIPLTLRNKGSAASESPPPSSAPPQSKERFIGGTHVGISLGWNGLHHTATKNR